MFRYCKNCGEKIYFEYGDTQRRCSACNELVGLKDTIAYYTVEARVNQLKAMHQLMIQANDENIYVSWIYLMPDCPNEEDFIDIAIDDEQYNECFDLFVELIAEKGNRY